MPTDCPFDVDGDGPCWGCRQQEDAVADQPTLREIAAENEARKAYGCTDIQLAAKRIDALLALVKRAEPWVERYLNAPDVYSAPDTQSATEIEAWLEQVRTQE